MPPYSVQRTRLIRRYRNVTQPGPVRSIRDIDPCYAVFNGNAVNPASVRIGKLHGSARALQSVSAYLQIANPNVSQTAARGGRAIDNETILRPICKIQERRLRSSPYQPDETIVDRQASEKRMCAWRNLDNRPVAVPGCNAGLYCIDSCLQRTRVVRRRNVGIEICGTYLVSLGK